MTRTLSCYVCLIFSLIWNLLEWEYTGLRYIGCQPLMYFIKKSMFEYHRGDHRLGIGSWCNCTKITLNRSLWSSNWHYTKSFVWHQFLLVVWNTCMSKSVGWSQENYMYLLRTLRNLWSIFCLIVFLYPGITKPSNQYLSQSYYIKFNCKRRILIEYHSFSTYASNSNTEESLVMVILSRNKTNLKESWV